MFLSYLFLFLHCTSTMCRPSVPELYVPVPELLAVDVKGAGLVLLSYLFLLLICSAAPPICVGLVFLS